MAEVGTVYVSVMPTTKGFAKALDREAKGAGISAGRGFNLSFGKLIGGSAFGNIIANAFTGVTTAISSSLGAAVSRVDTLENFPKVMTNLGYSSELAQAAIDKLSAGIDGMPTSLDGIVNMTQQLAPLCGGLEEATDLSLALNNMFLASGASTADQTRAMQQYSQMLARGKVELQDWRTLQEVMPGQLNQVAQAMLGAGKNSTDLYEALQEGKISMSDMNEEIKRLSKEGANGFASFEEQARTATEGIGTALENVRNRIAKAVGKILQNIGQTNISGLINSFSSQFGAIADVVIDFWNGMVSSIDFEGFASAWDGLTSSLSSVFSGGNTATSFGEAVGNALNGLIPVIQLLTPFVWALAEGLKFFADNAQWLAPILLILVVALSAMNVIGPITSQLQAFTGGLGQLTPLAAVSVPQLLAVGAAALLVGGGIALAAVGMMLLVNTAIQLVSAGPMAAVALIGLVAAVALFAVGLAVLGPVLTASALGIIAFGAAVLMIGAGIAIASAGLALLATQLPTISTYGASAALSMLSLAGGAAALGGGIAVAGAGLAVFAVAAAVAAVGVGLLGAAVLLAGAGIMLAAVGVMLLGAGMMLLAGSVTVVASGIMMMAVAFPLVAATAPIAAVGLGVFAAAAALAMFGVGAATPVFAAFAAAVVFAAGGASILAASLLLVMVSMPIIAMYAPIAASGVTMLASAALESSGSLSAAAPAFSAFGAACTSGAAGVLMATTAIIALSPALASSTAAAQASQAAFAAFAVSVGVSMNLAKSQTQQTMRSIVSAVQSAAATINSTTMTAHVNFSLGAMPHFSMSGSFNPATGSVPSIGVSWYAKGGIFSKPSIIGVGEAGEEVVESTDRLMSRIRDAVRSENNTDEMAEAIVRAMRSSMPEISLYMDTEKVAETTRDHMDFQLESMRVWRGR